MKQQTLLSDLDKSQLKRGFRKDLTGNVDLLLFTQKPSPVAVPGRDCRYCAETQQLLEEISDLSPKVNLQTVDFYQDTAKAKEYGISRIPVIVLGHNLSSRVKFYGIPSGYALVTIVENIKTISRGVSPLSSSARKNLRRLNKPVHIQVFVTPGDADCPMQARLAHAFALESAHISADVVEIQEFPALAKTYSVRSVPLTIVNEFLRLEGPISEAQLLEKVLESGVRSELADT